MGHFEDYLHFAALKIQKRYRGWKEGKDFLRICNRIVKVQVLVHHRMYFTSSKVMLVLVNSYCLCPWCPCRVNARVSLNLKCKKLQVESCLKSNLNLTHLEVVDTSGGCGASFVVKIVSEEFEGKRLLERHRMVNAALEEETKEIHALSVKKAVTPEQWKQLQQDSNQANPAA
ncbi:hypothetical protein AHAS_Ahas04G0166100 [Arachis hypogaea]